MFPIGKFILSLPGIRYLLMLFPGILFLNQACNSKESASEPTASACQLPAKSPCYLFLSGKMGGAEMQIHLVAGSPENGKIMYDGTMLLSDHPAPIDLYSGSRASTDSVLMLSFEENGEEFQLTGAIQADGSVEGICAGFRGKNEKFSLHPGIQKGGIAFRSLVKDTTFRVEGAVQEAFFSYHFLNPIGEKWLCDSLMSAIHGDSVCRAGNWDPASIFSTEGKKFSEMFRDDVTSALASGPPTETMNQEIHHGAQIYSNENGRLSIGLTEYDYFGGAHGIMFTRCMSFDLRKKTRIHLNDLFRPGFEQELKAALNAAARKKYAVENLQDVLFVEEIEIIENFFTTDKGLSFMYSPYEIAPFTMGEPVIFLPYSALKNILK